ncbi:MAG TPA: hypothetical protein VFK70_18215, partial [Vicinamibacteria bacterium]|nr:hypothetical protein [Vicinamibacteria bacterium]
AGFLSIPSTTLFRNSLKAGALVLVLGLHLAMRLTAAARLPLDYRTFYPRDYEVALSLMAGRGYHSLDVWSDTRPQASRVRHFLRMRRGELLETNWRRFTEGAKPGPAPTLATSRVLEMHVAAALWSLFGVRWSVLFAFYAALSTFVAFLIFLIARHLAGAFGAGILAAILFAASPYETFFATAGIRDISPLWFDTLAFAAVVLLAARARSSWAGAACALAAGAASTVGIGWRHDGWMAPPLALAGLFVLLRSQKRSPRETMVLVGSFVAGVALVGTTISAAGPNTPLGPQIGFHIAYYGNHGRSNLLGIENSFQALRNDLYTYQQAAYYALVTRGVADLTYWTGDYGSVCRDLYLQTLAHNGFDWMRGFPAFYVPALAGLGGPGALQGMDPVLLGLHRMEWLGPAYRFVLDPFTRCLPGMFILGGLTLLLVGRRRAEAALLIAFTVLYAAMLLAVLPESKHFGPMLLPLCTVAGAGLWRAASLAVSPKERGEAVQILRQDVFTRRTARTIGLGIAGVSVLAAVVAAVSSFTRHGYLAEIQQLAAHGQPAPETVLGPRLFSFVIPPEQPPDPRGFRLTIRTGASPSVLVCRHRRGFGTEETQRLYLTRHSLAPGRTLYFFVVGLQGAFQRDGRTYQCTVTLDGDAKIVESLRLDLSNWRRPVYSTVFGHRDWWPGSPRLPSGVQSTEFVGLPPKLGLDELTPSPDEGDDKADDEEADP